MIKPRTLSDLPLPDILQRLAPHVPLVLQVNSDSQRVSRPNHRGVSVPSGLIICPAEGRHLAMDLISQAQADGLTPRLEFWGEWRCELFSLGGHGWLSGRGTDERHPLLHAVAGACLTTYELRAGRTGWI
ncbi:hypothetical protein IHN63_03150 [Deinococcus sp. 6YEL10]|uniref:hypothetical protein n=1 Tax=Deinococcus sp. 6YEL10 TaxID=2745870 RepID=UPI001E38C2B7|nr:hypothetical protein [Deinococcus sp. 6YEL10]MCD0160297.1 hypothetical protein [Deinococcus sp. 6YEL10]